MKLKRFLTPAWMAAGLLSVLVLSFSVGLLVTSGALVTAAAARPDLADLMLFFVAVRFWGLGRAALRYAERLLSHNLVFHWLKSLRLQFFLAWQGLQLRKRLEKRSADLLLRATSDLETLQEAPLRLFLPWAAACGFCLLALALLFPIDAAASLSFLGAALFLGLFWPYLCFRIHRFAGRRRAITGGSLHVALAEGLNGGPELAFSGASSRWLDLILRREAQIQKQDAREALWNGWQETVSLVTANAFQLALVVFLGTAAQSGELAWPLAIGIILAGTASLEGFNNLGTAWMRAGMLNVLKRRLQLRDSGPPKENSQARLETVMAPGQGRLLAQGICVDLGGRSVLKGVSLELPQKGLVFILGPSGGGKSTLAKALLGLYEPSRGRLWAGTLPYGQLDSGSLRETFGTVAQDIHLLNRSLRENLTFGDDRISDESCLTMLGELNLDQRVKQLPRGLDTILRGGVNQFSGGELRRLGLARALLRPVHRYILDEPFEHLDENNQSRVMKLLREKSRDALVCVITHQIPHMEAEDIVYYMENGNLSSPLSVGDMENRESAHGKWYAFQKDLLVNAPIHLGDG